MSRLRSLATVALAGLAVFASSTSAHAAPSVGRQTMTCTYGSVTTTPPGGGATQGLQNSNTAAARWFVGLWHWNGQWQWQGWSQVFYADVQSNGGPGIGSAYGYLGSFRTANGVVVSSVSWPVTHGHYYAMVNYVEDSSGATYSYSLTSGGSYFCQA